MTTPQPEWRWTIGAGGFIGEVTVKNVSEKLVTPFIQRGKHAHKPLMFLSNLYVHPLRRKLGWANKLMKAATDYADANGLDLWLYADPYGTGPMMGLDTLKAFYRSHGFTPIVGAGYCDEMVRRCQE